MIDALILFNILKFINNPWDFINMLIALSDPSDVVDNINYFKKTREFQKLTWMYNVGVLARFTFFSHKDDNSPTFLIIKNDSITLVDMYADYGYYNDQLHEPENILWEFFTEVCHSYFKYWLFTAEHEDDVIRMLDRTYGFDMDRMSLSNLSTDEDEAYIKALDAKFATLYKSHAAAFKAGFNACPKKMIRNALPKFVVSDEKINELVSREIYCQAPFISKATGLTEKEDHHLTNKQTYKRSIYDNKKKEKAKRKHRYSSKSSRRHEKYANKLDCFA